MHTAADVENNPETVLQDTVYIVEKLRPSIARFSHFTCFSTILEV